MTSARLSLAVGSESAGSALQWIHDQIATPPWRSNVIALLRQYPTNQATQIDKSTLSSIRDPWIQDYGYAVATFRPRIQGGLLVSDLGWSLEKAAETRLRLQHFEEDWDAPGMAAYDAL